MARILIVDDQEADRLLVQAVLTRSGHDTIVVEDGEAALRAYLDSGVDIVITDLQMPDVHGFELIAILRELAPPPAIIALSGTGAFQLHMAESLGAGWTLHKPVDPQLLVATVREAEESREERRARRSS